MDINEKLAEFKKNYTKLSTDFSYIEEDDPITSVKLNMILQELDKWTNDLSYKINQHSFYKEEFLRKDQEALKTYQKLITTLNDSLSSKIDSITKDHIASCQKLKDKIEASKQNCEYTKEQLEVEYNYFVSTSELNKIILDNDFEEAKKRYVYQKGEAKESYLEIVKKNNIALEKIKEEIDKDYFQKVYDFQKECNETIDKLHHLIEIKSIELNSINAALETERNNMKEKYRQESAKLNEAIKKIADEKNKLIDKARSEYNKAMSDADIEKENKRAVYQAKSQALLKEFVTKINVIDEQTTKTKKDFDKKIDQVKRKYYFVVFLKDKKFHYQLEQIYNASPSIDKYTNHLLKFKNKQHRINALCYKKENELILLELTKLYTVKVNENRNNKNFLEIDKNFAIKNITDQEQFDNKYYQEKDNVYENDFNYVVKTANYTFAQKANHLRCQSQIRTKLLERNYDGIEANYYKRIEEIQNKINSYKMEIDLTRELNDLITKHREFNYQSQIHLEEINNLLEIEKNKLLKEFNTSQFECNMKNITLSKEYGYKKIDLENQRAEKFKNLKIRLEELLLEKNGVSIAFSIKKEELNERFSKIKTQLIHNNDLRTSKDKYLERLKNNDEDYLNQIINSYSLFFDDISKYFHRIIKIILSDIIPTEKNFHYLETLIKSYLQLLLSLFEQALLSLNEIVSQVLEKKMEYIYDFKYRSSMDALRENYKNTIQEYLNQKEEIIDKIDSSQKTIENFKQKIYTLFNDIEMLKQSNGTKKKKLDATALLTIKHNNLKIKDYREKIENFNQIIKLSTDDIAILDKKKLQDTITFNKECKRIEKFVADDTLTYQTFKHVMEDIVKEAQNSLSHFSLNDDLKHFTEKKLNREIEKQLNTSSMMIHRSRVKLNMAFQIFIKSCKNETEKKTFENSLEFQEEISKYNKQYNTALEEYQTEYHQTIAIYEKKVHEHNVLTIKTLNRYDDMLNQANMDYQNSSKAIQELNNELTQKFFFDYYALEDNNQKIINYHTSSMDQNDSTFKSKRQNLILKNTNEKNAATAKLKQLIKLKNEEIEHLPIAFKYYSQMLNKEMKHKNTDLHIEIKNAKTAFNLERKRIDKEINNLKTQLEQDKKLNEIEQKRNIILEKKSHISNLKHSIKSIRIKL